MVLPLFPMAFQDGVLHRAEQDVPPSLPFRCGLGCRTIHALSLAGLGGFRV